MASEPSCDLGRRVPRGRWRATARSPGGPPLRRPARCRSTMRATARPHPPVVLDPRVPARRHRRRAEVAHASAGRGHRGRRTGRAAAPTTCAARATSHSAEPGLARSKSISATASPSRKTTLSRFGSLWLTQTVAVRGGHSGRPAMTRAVEGSYRVVVAPQQTRDAHQGVVLQRPRRVRRDGRLAVDVAQDLASLLVLPEVAGCSVESHRAPGAAAAAWTAALPSCRGRRTVAPTRATKPRLAVPPRQLAPPARSHQPTAAPRRFTSRLPAGFERSWCASRCR